MNTCSLCRWQKQGHCHYNPPVVQLMMAQGIQGMQPQPVSFLPPVQADGFCSKFTYAGQQDITDVD